jgi:hypothetical protein
MHSSRLLALFGAFTLLCSVSYVTAGQPSCGCEAQASSSTATCEADHSCASGECQGHGCHKHCHKKNIPGLDRYFNCGCNGSYNYPVPPLYTYHWPGMYKQQRMTDYRSPWRFPPIRPYTDETGIAEVTMQESLDDTQRVSFLPDDAEDTINVRARSSQGVQSMSSRFESLSR